MNNQLPVFCKRLGLCAAMVMLVVVVGGAVPVQAQEAFERSPNLSGGWAGYSGYLYANFPTRFSTADRLQADIAARPTFELALGTPENMLSGVRFAPESPIVPGSPNEWEVFTRVRPMAVAGGDPLDGAVQTGYNVAAQSVDAELSLSRWLGPVRLMAAGRLMTAAYDGGDTRFAVAGGAVVHPLQGQLPLAISGDVGTLVDRRDGEQIAWGVGLDLGISFTNHTLSLFATNTSTSTVQGISRGDDDVRFGFELTIPIIAGQFVDWFVPREQAMEAVVEEPDEVDELFQAEVQRYLFAPKRIEIERGTTIEWTNTDGVVHTVTSEDGAWDSGAIPPGESWQARFDQPGTYAYYCSPHPFMKGVVVVR